MPLPKSVEGRVASLSDLMDTTVTADVTIDEILTNNAVIANGTQNNIVQNTITTITTVPANGIKYITKVICSGEENAKWDIFINSTLKMTKRTTDRTVDFDFSTPLKLAASSVLDVKATHHGPDATSSFSASVLGYQPT